MGVSKVYRCGRPPSLDFPSQSSHLPSMSTERFILLLTRVCPIEGL